jgi:DNA mismatch endonuclease, patch repair protein
MSVEISTKRTIRRKTIGQNGRSRIMAAIRKTNTGPELIVRRALRSLEYRFRTHVTELAGSPDIVIPSERTAIFVHGCFWHQHHQCGKGATPKVRRSYWGPKLRRNVARDRRAQRKLRRAGWRVLVVWECKTKDFAELTLKLGRSLKSH